MNLLKKFDFSEEVIKSFQEKRSIPVDFYNKTGQILIHKKTEAKQIDIDRIMRFINQGVYYKVEDEVKVKKGPAKGKVKEEEASLSDIKLLGKKDIIAMSNANIKLLETVKKSSINMTTLKKSQAILNEVFRDFQAQPDAMNGIVNIVELAQSVELNYLSKVMIKIAAIAMAMKARGMQRLSQKDYKAILEDVSCIMLSAFLCDISYLRMIMPKGASLSMEEYQYVQQHPIISYLMIAHNRELNSKIKQNVLLHHHPIRTAQASNNYPSLATIKNKLRTLQQHYQQETKHEEIVQDIEEQIILFNKNISYDEDTNMLSIASTFASLTSDVPWRKALDPIKAARKLINKSIFNYTYRITREFLDHTVMSLCHNQKVIEEGSYILDVVQNEEREDFQYEVSQVEDISHFQSRPGVRRIGILKPKIERCPQLQISDLNLESFRRDHRNAYYDLGTDNSRRISYLIDPIEDKEAYEKFSSLKSHFSMSQK